MVERGKFGPLGFSSQYPFSSGDLASAALVVRQHLEASPRSPWEAIRHLVAEVLYGVCTRVDVWCQPGQHHAKAAFLTGKGKTRCLPIPAHAVGLERYGKGVHR